LGAAVEQTVEDIRGAEENYFHILQRTMADFPWIVGFNKKLQNYADQNVAIAFEFADGLSCAKGFQDLARIETEFVQRCLQSVGEQETISQRDGRRRRQIRSKSASLADGSLH